MDTSGNAAYLSLIVLQAVVVVDHIHSCCRLFLHVSRVFPSSRAEQVNDEQKKDESTAIKLIYLNAFPYLLLQFFAILQLSWKLCVCLFVWNENVVLWPIIRHNEFLSIGLTWVTTP